LATPQNISIKKLQKIATLSLKNSLRLHFDSILLYKNKSYPSSFQLSVLALEEFGKSKAVADYVWNTTTHGSKPDLAFEKKFIEKLYYHPWKQFASIGRHAYDFSPKYANFIQTNGLEDKKQKAIYVGLEKKKGKINLNSKVSFPDRIKLKDAKRQMSLLNDIYKEIIFLIKHQGMYFDKPQMDEVLDESVQQKINKWTYRSSIKFKKKYIIKPVKSSS
jgi:AbiV family abortive infection protein